MKIDWLNIDEFCKDLPEVTTSKIYSKKIFHPDGLFSEKIFGPVKSYTCSCGIYYGRSKHNTVCPVCGVKIENSNVRRKNMAKIVLPFEVINPIMLFTIKRVKLEIYNIIMSMIMDNDVLGYYFDENKEKFIKVPKPALDTDPVTIPDGVILYSGPKQTYDLVLFEAQRNMETSRYWKFIYDRMDNFWMNNIGVVPPEFRPVSKSNNQQMRDEMNKYYLQILEFKAVHKDNQLNLQATPEQTQTEETSEVESSVESESESESTEETTQVVNPLPQKSLEDIYKFSFKNLQNYILDLYQFIFDKFSKKSGLIRGSILGKRIDFSGRCVIDPDPNLELDQCGIPYLMALEFYKLQVANRLLELKNFNGHKFYRFDPVLDFIDECIEKHDFCLFDIVSQIANNKLFILNRQPTLHRMGLMSFRCVVHKDYVIKTHPFICEPYNADYDGDQMAAYISLYPETEQSNKDHLFIMENLISPSTGDVCLSVNQDVVLGLYLLTQKDATPKVQYAGPKVWIGKKDGDILETYQGRVDFNNILPSNFPFFDEELTKGKIHSLLNAICKNYDKDTIKKVLDNIKVLGFSKTTEIGSTFSLKNLATDNRIADHISQIVDDKSKSLAQKYFELAESPLKKEIENNFPYANFIRSGSRGTWDQADQLIWCRGYVSNSKGQVVETPIKHNLVTGLTREEFLTSCYGARKALLDVALNTAVSGYLTRKLVYGLVNVELDENCDDCGTDQYMELTIPEELTDAKIEQLTADIKDPKERQLKIDELKIKAANSISPMKLAKSLRHRWYLDDDGQLKMVSENGFKNLLGKTIKLRSPIFCKNPRICKKCYGDLYKILHSKYIGVIAAQALGEVATQLTLRTFHVSGVAQMSKGQQDDTQQDIINDLTNVKKILHGGDDWNTTGYKDMIMKLFHIYSNHKTLMLNHFELAVSQLMRYGSRRWRNDPNRDEHEPNIVSIEKVPSLESLFLALAFSKPYVYIIGAIMGNAQTTDGILEKMLINKV